MTVIDQVLDDHCEVVLHRTDDNESDWLEARMAGLTGSDALAALGLDRRVSPAGVWARKTGRIPPEDDDYEPFVMGRILEPAVKKGFTYLTGIEVEETPFLLRSVAWPWMLASPDGALRDPERGPGLFEAKTTTVWLRDEWADDQVPERAAAQTMHYLAVTGLPFAYVAVLIDNRVQWRLIERNDTLIEAIVEAEHALWQRIELDVMPDVTYHPGDLEAIEARWPEAIGGKILELTDDQLQLVENWKSCKSQASHWDKRAKESGQLVRAMFEDAEAVARDGKTLATYKTSRPVKFQTAAFRDAEPEMFARFSKAGLQRTLRAVNSDDADTKDTK